MSPRGPRHRVAPGIYQDAIGYAAVVKHKGRRIERRFNASKPLADIQGWRTRQKALIDLDKPVEAKSGTLAEDIARYLALLPAGRTKQDAARLFAHWSRALGMYPRADLTAPVLHAQLLTWHRDGAAPQTVNHRRRVLVALYKALDGSGAANPAAACPKLPVPRPEPRGLSWKLITAILAQIEPCATKTRLTVLAHTGWSHAILSRLTRHDLHLSGPSPYVVIPPRRKGKGAPARAVPVTLAAAKALKRFAAEDLFGPYSHHSVYKTFKLAASKVDAPPNLRVYDLRHSFGVRAYAASKDLRAVAELMQHSHLGTTARYAQQAVSSTAQAAVRKLQGGTAGGTTTRTRGKPLRARSSVG